MFTKDKTQKCKLIGKMSFLHYQTSLHFLRGKLMLVFMRRMYPSGDLINRSCCQRWRGWTGIKMLLSLVLCDVLEEWDGFGHWAGGRSKREWILVCICLIHFIIQQRLTQHCKAVIVQFKKRRDWHSPLFIEERPVLSVTFKVYAGVSKLWSADQR